VQRAGRQGRSGYSTSIQYSVSLKRGFIRRHTIEVDMDKVESVMSSQKGARARTALTDHKHQSPSGLLAMKKCPSLVERKVESVICHIQFWNLGRFLHQPVVVRT